MTLAAALTITEGDIACSCGNTTDSDGFETCTPDGFPCEPLADGPWAGHYLCTDCGHFELVVPQPVKPALFTKTHEMVAEFKLVREAKAFADCYIFSWSTASGVGTKVTDLVVEGRKVTWTATVTHPHESELYSYPQDLLENAGAIGGTSAKVNGRRAPRIY